MKVKSEREVAQSCPTLRDPMDCSLPGSSVHGIFQARVLEWGAIAFSKALPTSSKFQLLKLFYNVFSEKLRPWESRCPSLFIFYTSVCLLHSTIWISYFKLLYCFWLTLVCILPWIFLIEIKLSTAVNNIIFLVKCCHKPPSF